MIYENLYNAYCDYMYLNAIGEKTNNNYNLHSRTLSNYICFINHIIEMTKRDFVNCIYKLIFDNRSFTFSNFCTMILEEFNYLLPTPNISNIPLKAMKLLRNNYLSHSTIENINASLTLKDLFESLKDIIYIYNEAIKFVGVGKELSDLNLKTIKENAHCGVNQMFNNISHRKIYGDLK